ncbi:efflux RND transporter periplasmic adaptor subunit [Hyphobacterium indicum]|jgi:RND family efflux transporter MFP subunit|uniref:efflux RND transporter periplasmic adaptor subunit n=1 Tax=Hyphobacterium indicum TaxID=2162714 RepID=UPI000D6502AC|nr:efflux RND transporter periplasmic adaptor subunit [Hyphobacterium indicum]
MHKPLVDILNDFSAIRRILSLLALGLIVGCSDAPDTAEITESTERTPVIAAPVSVVVGVTQRQSVLRTISATGTITPKRTSDLGSLVDGVISEVLVNVGDHVQQGDPLFRTSDVNYQHDVASAVAAHQMALAQATQAQRAYERAAQLAERDIISPAQLEQRETEMSVANAAVTQTEQARNVARQRLADTLVTAPFDGAIIGRFVDEGTYMSSRFSGMGSSAVVRLAECQIGVAVARFPESELTSVHEGQTAQLYIGFRTEPISAPILVVNDAIDVQTRTGELRAPFLNPNCGIQTGQFVRVEIEITDENILTIPQSAIVNTGLGQRVFIVENGHAVRRSIEAISIDGVLSRVVTGLNAGDAVILSPPDTMTDGVVVEVIQP